MKNLLFVFLLLPAFALAGGKDTARTGQTYIGLNAGVGLAPERMISPASNSIWMDYFEPGYTINLTARAQLFHSQFGLAGKLSFCSNGFDIGKYLALNTPNVTSTVTSLSYGSFTQFSPMIGISFRHSFGKLAFEARLLGGKEFITLPNSGIDVKDPPTQPEFTWRQEYITNPGFDWDAGIGLSYFVCKGLSAMFNIDFLNGSATYGLTQSKDYINGVNYSYTSSSTAAVAFVSSTLGLCYNYNF